MKTERRHELQTNTLADWIGRTIEDLRPYYTGILGAVVLVVVLVIVLVWWQRQSRSNQQLGWEQLLSSVTGSSTQSLENVADQFPDSSVGCLARLQMGNLQLNAGITHLFTDPAEGKDQLRKAIETFLIVQNEASEPLLQQQAAYGLARAHESLNQLQEAEQYYQDLDEKWVDGIYSETARRRLADLRRPETKKFYDWFEDQESLVSASGAPGQSGTRLPFDTDSLPDEPDALSPFDTGMDAFPTEPPVDTPLQEPATGDASDDTPETPPADDSTSQPPPENPAGEAAADDSKTDDAAGDDSPSESPGTPE